MALGNLSPPPDLAGIAAASLAMVRQAGELALSQFAHGSRTSADISWKDGGSPVTAVDHSVDAFLCTRLQGLLPGAAWYSEERPEGWHALPRGPAFVIDPIDGTRQFMEGRSGWCISLALVADGVPIMGIVHAPALDETLHAHAGGGAWRNGERLSHLLPPGGSVRVTGPIRGLEFVHPRIPAPIVPMPHVSALARRIGLTASGAHDLALARAGGHDWDVAAADCLLREVGGGLHSLDGQSLPYTLDGSELPAFIAGERSFLEKITASP